MGVVWTRLTRFVRNSSRLVLGSAAAALFSALFFVINMIHPVLPWGLVWLPSVVGSVLMLVNFWRTARTDHLPKPTRRLWRHLLLVGVLVGLGSLSQVISVLTAADPTGPHTGTGQMVFCGAAILVVIYALFRMPFGEQTRGEVFRVVLDAGTVMLACAVFAWHFSTRPALERGDPHSIYASTALYVMALFVVFALAKVMLTSHTAYLDRGSLRMIGIAVVVGAVGPPMRPLIEPLDPHLYPDMIDLAVIYFCGALGAERQRRADHSPRRGVRDQKRRRPFSFLPYVAIGAVDALLLAVTLPAGAPDRQVVVISAVTLTALVVVRQITAFMDNGRLLRRLDHGATHDALTQLPNRVLFHERLQKALTGPADRPVAVALIDLDDFKVVNDTLGHEVGDLLLITVASRLAGCVRAEDTVARLGGDEFVVVLDGADPEAAGMAAHRMIEALADPVLADGHELPVRASIGIADGRAGDDPSVLLRRADIAMYAAKLVPGTAALHYHPGMAQGGPDQSTVGADLREALERGELFLLYQPIVALDSGRLLGVEALIRWRHPRLGTLLPDAFLPSAERTGLIVPVTHWVLRTALAQLATWDAAHGGSAPATLNVNVSPRDLREPQFAAVVADLLESYGIAAERITLEVTESIAAEPTEAGITVRALRALGLRVALDDFGTGPASLTTLHDVPMDELKLDRSFTQAAFTDEVPVAAAVHRMAAALGMNATAEGVETPAQAAHLQSLGYHKAQGYYFAYPMPAEELSLLLHGTPLLPAA
jgi:diguanylate cyclase (GGDEF)-like protein